MPSQVKASLVLYPIFFVFAGAGRTFVHVPRRGSRLPGRLQWSSQWAAELPVEVVVLVLHALGLDLRLQRPSHRVVRGSTACVDEVVLALFYCVAVLRVVQLGSCSCGRRAYDCEVLEREFIVKPKRLDC